MTDPEDLDALLGRLRALDRAADGFGRTLSRGLSSAVIEGRALDEVLSQIVLRLSAQTIDAALAPLGNIFGNALSGLVGAVLPTAATAAPAASAPASPSVVTVNIQTPDAESFRRSEAQVAAMLARTVGRGRRGM